MKVSLGRKVQILLALSLAFVALLGTSGLVSTSALGGNVSDLVEDAVPTFAAVSRLSTSIGRAAGAAATIENAALDAGVHEAALKLADEQLRIAKESAEALRKGHGDATLENLTRALADWHKDFASFAETARARDAASERFAEAAALQSRVSEHYEALRKDNLRLFEAIDAAIATTQAAATALRGRAESAQTMARWGTLLTFLLAGVVLVAVGMILLRSVRRSLAGLKAQAHQLEAAVQEGRLGARADVDSVDAEFQPVIAGMNATMDAFHAPLQMTVDYVGRISRGDIPPPITDRYQGDFDRIKDALNRCVGSLDGLIREMSRMAELQGKGDTDAYVAEARFEGAYREMAAGVNAGVRMHVGNLLEILEVLGAYSNGDFNPVLRRLPGKQAVANDKLDLLRENLRRVARESKGLIQAAVEGRLSARADASAFEGDWKAIVQGFNDTLDAVVGPLNASAKCVAEIARGEIPPTITAQWAGDFAQLRESLNGCIGAVNALVADANQLAGAAVAGRLETRADAARHQGDFRKVVDGVNRTLDALLAPVGEAAAALERLAARDLLARMEGSYAGGHARIKDAVNSTAKALHDALAQVSEAVEQVSSAATQIASSSQSVASGASEQAASLQETRSSLDSVSAVTRQAADNAQQAQHLVEGAQAAAGAGSNAVAHMQGAVGRIRSAAESTSQIIRDINDIAFQTNLLALNAAVEAARAGEAGRGFAVVAEEVRSLALRSKEAALKTEELIRQSVKEAGEGEVSAREVASKLTQIVEGVGKATAIVSEIAGAAKDQARAIDEVTRAVAEMDKVTQQNAASAEQSSSAASELSGQSEELASMVGSFRFERSSGGDRRARGPAPRALASPRAAAPRAARSAPPRAERSFPMENEPASINDF